MKIRNYTRPGQPSRSLVRVSNVVNIFVDQGKDWRKEESREFDTVAAAKYFMSRPNI